MPGRLINTNTVDAFKAMDKNALLESVGKEVRPRACSHSPLTPPALTALVRPPTPSFRFSCGRTL